MVPKRQRKPHACTAGMRESRIAQLGYAPKFRRPYTKAQTGLRDRVSLA